MVRVEQDLTSWQQRYDDSLAGLPPRPRDRITDLLAHYAGRDESEAARLGRLAPASQQRSSDDSS